MCFSNIVQQSTIWPPFEILIHFLELGLIACHHSGVAIFGFKKVQQFSFPTWKTKHLPVRPTIILPGQRWLGLQVFTSRWLSPWCLAFAVTPFEASNGGTSSGNQLCSQGLSTLSHTRVAAHTHTSVSYPALALSPSHSPEWQLLNCDKRAVSDQPPYLGDWLNDLSITQPLLYSPSTDRVTHVATQPICQDRCHRRCH